MNGLVSVCPQKQTDCKTELLGVNWDQMGKLIIYFINNSQYVLWISCEVLVLPFPVIYSSTEKGPEKEYQHDQKCGTTYVWETAKQTRTLDSGGQINKEEYSKNL